jgi:hypothetical protein
MSSMERVTERKKGVREKKRGFELVVLAPSSLVGAL